MEASPVPPRSQQADEMVIVFRDLGVSRTWCPSLFDQNFLRVGALSLLPGRALRRVEPACAEAPVSLSVRASPCSSFEHHTPPPRPELNSPL